MTNEEYIQWIPLIKKLALKYKNNIFKIELEDLEQIASIGLFKGFKSYNESKGMSLKTWLYNSAERAIFREFTDMKRIKRQSSYESISLNTPIGEDDAYLGDIIPDTNVNVENDVVDKLLIASYKEEVNSCLFGPERDIVYKTLFENKTYSSLSTDYNLSIDNIKSIQKRGFRHLTQKSKMIRDKWREIKEMQLENEIISAYNNPDSIYHRIETTKYLREKYKLQLDILDFIQEIFDKCLYSFYPDEKIKIFYIDNLREIIGDKDLFLLNEIVFNKTDTSILSNQGYSFDDVFNIRNRVKTSIFKQKELAYDLWLRFNKDYKEKTKCNIEAEETNTYSFATDQVTLDMILGI